MNGAYISDGRGYDWDLTSWSPACSKYELRFEGHLLKIGSQWFAMVADLENEEMRDQLRGSSVRTLYDLNMLFVCTSLGGRIWRYDFERDWIIFNPLEVPSRL